MRPTRRLTAIACAAMLVMLLTMAAGCSYVAPADRQVIHAHHLNAQAIAAKAETDPALPDYAQQWWTAEAKTWRALDAWAKGEKFDAAGD